MVRVRPKNNMSVMDKIAAERRKVLEQQERKKNGKFGKKKRDSFLLWGEYPSGWQMIKDSILCIMLMGALIGKVKQIDIAELMAPKTITFVQQNTIAPAQAKEEVVAEKKEEVKGKVGEFSAYSSEVAQTDSDPFTMASGKRVYDGAIANNCLAFGTKVKVNGKVKVVEDRMNSRYGCDHFDIWIAETNDALAFGRKNIEYTVVD